MEGRILVVSDFSGNTAKIERHVGPLADRAGTTTMVCTETGVDPAVENVDYRTVPTFGFRPLDLLALFCYALVLGVREEYDGVVTFSLVPYGLFGLVVGRVADAPVHLGVLGIDADLHAVAWYGPAVRAAFRRFDAVSVPGKTHRERLVRMGVDPARVATLSNAIDHDVYRPPGDDPDGRPYDFVWVGRLASEKDPLLFVRALAAVRERGHEFDAAMLGDGPMRAAVEAEIERAELAGSIDLVGWVDDPIEYYRRARIFALTSSRDALALSLLEAMATGLAPVAPPVGNTTDAVTHRENGYLVRDLTPASLADAFEELLSDDAFRAELAARAEAVGPAYSYGSAREDWERIVGIMRGRGAATDAPSART